MSGVKLKESNWFQSGGKSFFLVTVFFLLSFFFSLKVGAQCRTWYRDLDGDGFGNSSSTQISCIPLAGYVLNQLDCNDSFANASIRQSIGGGVSSGQTIDTKIEIGSDGMPIVLYQNFTTSGLIHSTGMRKYNGASWVTLGADPISTVYDISTPNFTLDNSGVPYLSFTDFDPLVGTNNKVTVLKYNSGTNAWDLVGSRRFSSTVSNDRIIDIKFDNSNTPYVTLMDDMSNAQVMKFDNLSSTWVQVGAAGFSAVSSELSINFDSSNTPYVAFSDASDGKITVRKFDGTNWVTVGSPSFSDNDIPEKPEIAFNSADEPYVAYFDNGFMGVGAGVVVQKFVSGAWAKVGTTPVHSGFASSVSMAIDLLGVPYVAFENDAVSPAQVVLKKFNSTTNVWDNTTSSVDQGSFVSVAIGPDNVPYISFSRFSDGDKASAEFVGPQPVAPDAPTVSATLTTICAGASTTLNITAGNLNDGTQWVWYTDAGAGGCGVGASAGTGATLIASPTVTTTYYARGEGSCTPGTCSTITIVVKQYATIPTLSATSTTICTGGSTTLNITAGSLNDATSWVWYKGGCGTGASIGTGTSLLVSPTATTTYYVRGEGLCNSSSCASITIIVNDPAVIIAQPTASQTLCSGAAMTLTVGAIGTGLSYQWKRGGVVIGGATSNVFNIASVSVVDGATYTVDVTSSGVCVPATVTSANAVVVINTPATITSQPLASQTLCSSATLNLSVTATGTGLSYQWKKGGSTIAGATSNAYGIVGVVPADAATYTVDVASSGVCVPATVTSGNAVVVINTPATITSQPVASQTLCSGATLNLSVGATGTGLNYQWKKGGSTIAGATSVGYSIAGLVPADAATYTVDVTSSGVCTPATVTSNNADVIINTPATIATQPVSSQTLCVNAPLGLSVSATGTGLSYQWKKGGANIGGATSNSYSITNVVSADAATYTVAVTSSGVCTPATVTSNNADVIINTPATIATQPVSSQALCVNAPLSLSVSATGTGLSYQWKKGGSTIAGATSNGYSIAGAVPADAATYTVDVTSSGVCAPATVTSSNAVVIINTPTSITAQPTASQSLCPGATLNLSVTATGSSLSYQWKKGGTNIAGATSNTYTIASVSSSDAGTYSVEVTGPCAPLIVTSSNAIVSINNVASITTQPSDVTKCLGSDVNFTVTAAGTNLNYQWQKNTSIPGSGAGSGFLNIIDDEFFSGSNTATLTIKSVDESMDKNQFKVMVTGNCVFEMSGAATLNVNTLPEVSAGPDKIIQQGGDVVLEGSVSGDLPILYQWVELAGTPQATILQPKVSPTSDAYYTLSATSAKGCEATDQVFVKVDSPFVIPNAFSPNNDGINDTWKIENLEIFPKASVQVYNRYGEPVFTSSNSSSVLWDGTYQGKRLPWGTYYYIIDLKNGDKPLNGWVVIFN